MAWPARAAGAAPAANPFQTANPYRPATIAPPAAPAAANPFAVRAGAAPAVPAAAPVAGTQLFTKETTLNLLPPELVGWLKEENALVYNHEAWRKVVEKTVGGDLGTKLATLSDKLTELAACVSNARTALLREQRKFNAVEARHSDLSTSLNALYLRAHVAATDGVEAVAIAPEAVLLEELHTQLAHATTVFTALEALELPADDRAAAEAAARADAAAVAALRAALPDGVRGGGGGGGGAAGGGGGGGGGGWGATTAYGSAVDDIDMGHLRETAAAYTAALPTMELVKQVLVAQAGALTAVAGGPVAALHERIDEMRRRFLQDINRGVAAPHRGLGIASWEPSGLAGAGGQKYRNPFEDADGEEEAAKKKEADKRELRAAPYKPPAGAAAAVPAAANPFGAKVAPAAAPAGANPFAVRAPAAPVAAAGANPFAVRAPAAPVAPAAPPANPFAPRPGAGANPFGLKR